MNDSTVRQLLKINREFYSEFADDFSETRSSARINLVHILPYLQEGVKLLDLGCGNGRLAQRLDREKLSGNSGDPHLDQGQAHSTRSQKSTSPQAPRAPLIYVGIDAAAALIEMAQAMRLVHLTATFFVADVTQPDWTQLVRDTAFDLTVALAVLHHIPSYDLRVNVLANIRGLLNHHGKILMTNWKFDENARLTKKIVPWSTLGIDEASLETGDALITWRRGGTGYRYVHLITPEEMQRLARDAGLKVERQFYADAGLNLYSVLNVL